MKPWWMSTVSLSLMSSEQYNVKLNLNPGFCPYIPALKLDQIHKTQLVLEDTFKEADRKITTLGWQKLIPFIENTFPETTNGFRNVSKERGLGEEWLTFSQE